jgi:hypothetical protein
MKKNELIEKLQEIQGNPEVVIYNGATGYCHSISKKYEEDLYVKYCEDHIFSNLKFEKMKERNSFDDLPEEMIIELRQKAKQMVKESIWDTPNPYHKKEDYKKYFGRNQKKVVIFNLLQKGITSFDRLGSYDC